MTSWRVGSGYTRLRSHNVEYVLLGYACVRITASLHCHTRRCSLHKYTGDNGCIWENRKVVIGLVQPVGVWCEYKWVFTDPLLKTMYVRSHECTCTHIHTQTCTHTQYTHIHTHTHKQHSPSMTVYTGSSLFEIGSA